MAPAGADRALAAAEAYVACIDRRSQVDRSTWLADAHRAISELYAAVVALDWDDNDSDDDRSDRFTNEEWRSLVNELRQLLGPLDMAWEVFDPYGPPEDEPVHGSVADAMADVYDSATNALRIARAGSIPDATNELLVQLEIALGHHALDVMRALDSHRFHTVDPEATILIDQAIAVEPAQVYAEWLSADRLSHWWWPHIPDTTYHVDARIGGSYEIRSEAAGIGVHGEFLEFDPPKLIRLTWNWMDEGVSKDEENVQIAFTATREGTLVTVTHELAGKAGDGGDLRQGWHDVLARLAGTARE